MSDDTPQIGSLARNPDGSVDGTLHRLYAGHACAEVWAMLTEPARMAQWLAPGRIEPRQGGAVKIDFHDSGIVIESTVLDYAPPHLLAYSWSSGTQPARPLRWQLEAAGDDTRLTLTVHVPAGEDPAKACGGFEGHLEMLAAALEGVPIKFPFDLFLAARAAYRKQWEG